MRTVAIVCGVSLLLTCVPSTHGAGQKVETGGQRAPARQLAAVRGEVTKMTAAGKGMLFITVRPAKEFQEVIVLARENDLVGSAVSRAGEPDLLGLLSEEALDDEMITAAELNEGDAVSVIYDPQSQNRVLEIYLH